MLLRSRDAFLDEKSNSLIDNDKGVYVFDQVTDGWFIYDYQLKKFIPLYVIPTLTKHFAGIGTRELKDNGRFAIHQLYKHTFNKTE